MSSVFLNAEWRKLAMINYSVDHKILLNHLPPKTEIDTWNNICYVSLVGFMFLNTRIKGFKIPFHINFEEVNLRFYVRYNNNGSWKRGVVFIKEFVPKPALTFIANTIYKEHYETVPMHHSWESNDKSLKVNYSWKKEKWYSIELMADPVSVSIANESEEEFITEHFWGYTKIGKNKTSEYGVEHPRWNLYPVRNYSVDVDFENLYGPEFELLNKQKPVSVFLAEGSDIIVRSGTSI